MTREHGEGPVYFGLQHDLRQLFHTLPTLPGYEGSGEGEDRVSFDEFLSNYAPRMMKLGNSELAQRTGQIAEDLITQSTLYSPLQQLVIADIKARSDIPTHVPGFKNPLYEMLGLDDQHSGGIFDEKNKEGISGNLIRHYIAETLEFRGLLDEVLERRGKQAWRKTRRSNLVVQARQEYIKEFKHEP